MARTKEASSEPSGVTEHDENYLGTAPEYENSAYEVTAPIPAEDPGEPDEDDEAAVAAKAAYEAEQRVKEHTEAMVQPAPEQVPFDEWVETQAAAGTEEEPEPEPVVTRRRAASSEETSS